MQSPQSEILRPENLEALGNQKWTLLKCAEKMFPVTLPLQELRASAQQSWEANLFKPAGIGRGSEHSHQPQIRSDSILWLDWQKPELAPFEKFLEGLKIELNQQLMLGIQAFEAHLARYAEGQFYQEHLDQPRAQSFLHGERLISFVLYLNRDWVEGDGGELQIRDTDGKLQLIQPRWGNLVLFDSKTILHQVLPSKRDRWSLTGWFRRS